MAISSRFQVGCGCTAEELAKAIGDLEADLVSAEARANGPDALRDILERRREFKALTDDSSIPSHELASYFEKKYGKENSFESSQIDVIRDVLENHPIIFTSCEEPRYVYTICSSFKLVASNLPSGEDRPHLIIATDAEFRPHASIRKLKGNLYSLLFSGNLIADLMSVAGIFAELSYSLQPAGGPNDFIVPFEAGTLRKAFEDSNHNVQLPLLLASISLGEPFRFATTIRNEDVVMRWATKFYQCMMAFLLGHELGHFQLGHFGSAAQETDGLGPFGEVLDPSSPLSQVRASDPLLLKLYRERYAFLHARELNADLGGVLIAGNVAVDLFQHRVIGYLAASVVLSVIALLDRIAFIKSQGYDPLRVIGDETYNTSPVLLDIMVPQESHPWGRTRHSLLGLGLLFADVSFQGDQWDRLSQSIREASYPISRSSHGAISTVFFSILTGCEIMCHLGGQELLGVVWKRNADGGITVEGDFSENPSIFLEYMKRASDRENGVEAASDIDPADWVSRVHANGEPARRAAAAARKERRPAE